MTVRQVLSAAYAHFAERFGPAKLEELLTDTAEAVAAAAPEPARDAVVNRAGIAALSQIAQMPRARTSA